MLQPASRCPAVSSRPFAIIALAGPEPRLRRRPRPMLEWRPCAEETGKERGRPKETRLAFGKQLQDLRTAHDRAGARRHPEYPILGPIVPRTRRRHGSARGGRKRRRRSHRHGDSRAREDRRPKPTENRRRRIAETRSIEREAKLHDRSCIPARAAVGSAEGLTVGGGHGKCV